MRSAQATLATQETSPNQREVVGVFRRVLTLRPSASAEQLRCCLECMKWASRFQVPATFGEEWSIMRSCFDAALTAAFRSWKRGSENELGFLRHFEVECKMMLPWREVEDIMNEKRDWSHVYKSLDKVVGSGHLGKRLFGFALSQAIASDIEATITTRLDNFVRQAGEIKEAGIAALRRELSTLR